MYSRAHVFCGVFGDEVQLVVAVGEVVGGVEREFEWRCAVVDDDDAVLELVFWVDRVVVVLVVGVELVGGCFDCLWDVGGGCLGG